MVARDSSPDLAISAEFTVWSILSKPMPAFRRLSAMAEVMAPSTAARPPVPMPSLSTAISRPQPSKNTLVLSPQKAPPPAQYWEKPRPICSCGRWHICMRQRSSALLTQGGAKARPQASETSLVKEALLSRFCRSRLISASTVMRPYLSTRQQTSRGVTPLSRRIPATRPADSSSKRWYMENSPAISSKIPAVVRKWPSTTSRTWAARSSAASFMR